MVDEQFGPCRLQPLTRRRGTTDTGVEADEAGVLVAGGNRIDAFFEQADIRCRLPRNVDRIARSCEGYQRPNLGLGGLAEPLDVEASRDGLVRHEDADAARGG